MIDRADPLDYFIGDRFFVYLMLLFRQCFQGICEIPSRMGPAPCEDDGFVFPVQLPVGRVSIADNDTGESFQEIPRMVYWGIPLSLSRPVDPHVTLAVRRTPILRYFDRSLIGLQHMEAVHSVMTVIIKRPQITGGTLDHPVGHHLPGNVDVIAQEFLTDPL